MVERPEDMVDHIGAMLGPGPWVSVDQSRIDDFARATEDFHWMHVDAERARETPTGSTIAHGFLSLSLIPALTRDMWAVRTRGGSYNYGMDKVRFITPVPSGARLRARQEIAGVDRVDGATRIRCRNRIEIEGQEKLALIADTIIQIFDAEQGWARSRASSGVSA
ncbi:MAG: MaoC family dehydratase [Sphingobium sp.]|nr:MaoC family dehydratase [Sphingobium sp.]